MVDCRSDAQTCDSSSSFQSSAGMYEDGYCIWEWNGEDFILQSCHCKTAQHKCQKPQPGGSASPPLFEGERRKERCCSPT